VAGGFGSRRRGVVKERVLRTRVRGEVVELPGTIAGIREALANEAEQEEFEREVENVGADEMFGVLAKWALRTPQAYDPDEEALVERLKAGDLTGMIPAEDLGDDAYRSAG
jgi:hypothetical protein